MFSKLPTVADSGRGEWRETRSETVTCLGVFCSSSRGRGGCGCQVGKSLLGV